MQNRHTPRYKPVKILLAMLLVGLVFFTPVVNKTDETPSKLQSVFPELKPFASSADACPWACIECTSWDDSAWPRGCATYECNAACEGEPGSGGGGPVYQPPTISHVLTCSNPGNNGWCIGSLSLDLSASDPQGQSVIISGDINGTPFTCPNGNTTCSIPLSEGTGTLNYKVDAATGLSASGSASYQVDVTTPQISGSLAGTAGQNGWYVSPTLVTASPSDTLSGIASFEVNVDNAGYTTYADTTFTDGVHTIQYRAYDNAGNYTEVSQTVMVDTIAPSLSAPGGLHLSEIMNYRLDDATSGLAQFSAFIADKDQRQGDAGGAWAVSGNSYSGTFFWDGTFANDGARVGNYLYTLTVTDLAGNQASMMGAYEVQYRNLVYLGLVPNKNNKPDTPPLQVSNPSGATLYQSAPTEAPTEVASEAILIPTEEPAPAEPAPILEVRSNVFEGTSAKSAFTAGNQTTTTTPISNANILWGGAATALLGATLAEWQRKRAEEEAARLAALRNSGGGDEGGDGGGRTNAGRKAYQAMMQEKRIVGALQAEQNAKAQAAKAELIAKNEDRAPIDIAKVNQIMQAQSNREKLIAKNEDRAPINEVKVQQLVQQSVDAKRWAGVASVAQAKQKGENKTWLQKAWENTQTFVQAKIVSPVTTFWNEKIYEPYIQPAVQWVQENIIQPVITFWNEKVYKPYIQPVVTWVNENIVEPVKTVFQENPKAAWGTAAVVTTATIAGTVYYIDCYGTPSFTPPVSSLVNFAGMFSLPITGWLTTSRKQRVYGILVGMLMLGMLLSACGGGATGNTPVAMPTGNALCPVPNTPVTTETPTLTLPTATPDVYQNLKSTFLPSGNYAMLFLDDWIDEYNLANQSYNEYYNAFLKGLGYSDTEIGVMDTKTKAMIVWQNYYNKDILEQAQIYGIDPALLKGQMLAESNGAIDPGGYLNDGTYDRNDLYVGLMQISRGELANVLGDAPEELLAQTLNLYSIMGIHSPLPEYSQKRYKTYSGYYLNSLSDEQRQDFADIALRLVDGQCFVVADASMDCGGGNPPISNNGINYLVPMVNEGSTSIQFAAAINANNRKNFVDGGYISSENWSQLSKVDQDKLMLAAFNGGMDGIGEAVNAIVIQNGKLSSWDEVQAELQKGKETYTPSWCQAIVYPDNAVCYANGGNNCTIKLASCNP